MKTQVELLFCKLATPESKMTLAALVANYKEKGGKAFGLCIGERVIPLIGTDDEDFQSFLTEEADRSVPIRYNIQFSFRYVLGRYSNENKTIEIKHDTQLFDSFGELLEYYSENKTPCCDLVKIFVNEHLTLELTDDKAEAVDAALEYLV